MKWNQIILRTIIRSSGQENLYRLIVTPELMNEDDDVLAENVERAIRAAAKEFADTPQGAAFLVELKRMGFERFDYLSLASIPAQITVRHGFVVKGSLYADVTLDNVSLQ